MLDQNVRPGRKRVLVVTRNPPMRARSDTAVVGTPLDMIRTLQEQQQIATVVLMGAFAANGEFAQFLVESYPSLRVLAGTGEEPDAYIPAYA